MQGAIDSVTTWTVPQQWPIWRFKLIMRLQVSILFIFFIVFLMFFIILKKRHTIHRSLCLCLGGIVYSIPCRTSCFVQDDFEEQDEFIFFQIILMQLVLRVHTYNSNRPVQKSYRGKELDRFFTPNRRDDLCLCFCLYPSSFKWINEIDFTLCPSNTDYRNYSIADMEGYCCLAIPCNGMQKVKRKDKEACGSIKAIQLFFQQNEFILNSFVHQQTYLERLCYGIFLAFVIGG